MTDAMVAIARAQASYVRAIDSGNLEAWPDFFTDPCFYQITTADNYRRGLPAGLIWADVDRYVIDSGRALLRRRVVVCDSSRIDTLLALPL
jgi:anthranilate 1,2-dioxygenase small subunit